MSFLAPLKKVIEFCGKCKRPMAGNYPVCMNRSCIYFNRDTSERQAMEKMKLTLETDNAHIDPIMDLQEFEVEPLLLNFAIPTQSKESGVARCSVEVLWKKGKMDWLLVSFPNVDCYSGKVFQIELQNSRDFMVSGEFLQPISGWCPDHKTQYINFCVYGKSLRIHKLETVLIEVK